MQTLIQNPTLKIQSNEEGVWLSFENENGLMATINLPALYCADEKIVGRALVEWCRQYALKPKQATIQDLIDDLESENKIPARLIPFQLHGGLRQIQNILVEGKYGAKDKNGIEFLKQYMNERNR